MVLVDHDVVEHHQEADFHQGVVEDGGRGQGSTSGRVGVPRLSPGYPTPAEPWLGASGGGGRLGRRPGVFFFQTREGSPRGRGGPREVLGGGVNFRVKKKSDQKEREELA